MPDFYNCEIICNQITREEQKERDMVLTKSMCEIVFLEPFYVFILEISKLGFGTMNGTFQKTKGVKINFLEY